MVGSRKKYLLAPDDLDAVIDGMVRTNRRIISHTITEGGYFISAKV